MVLSKVRSWNGGREDNNNSLKKRDILRTPPSQHPHARCELNFSTLILF